MEPDDRRLRSHYVRLAAAVFGVTALSMVIVCGAVIVSGWFAGVMTDRWERFFWAGAITAALAVFTSAIAAAPVGSGDRVAIQRIRTLTALGIALFIVAALLCVGALIADFYR